MKGLIVSVGGSPQAVARSILEHRPAFVCFFASQQSIDNVGEVKAQLKADGLVCEDYKVICDDAEDLVHCYDRALGCVARITGLGLEPAEVTVDYTGGTKSMTAALALATVGHGYSFSYVGGSQRAKNGLGTVINGHEVVRQGPNPWHIFAVEEKKRIALYVNSFQYEAAQTALTQTLHRLPTADREVWTALIAVFKAYQEWDNFNHKGGLRGLRDGVQAMTTINKLGHPALPSGLLAAVTANQNVLTYIQKETDNFGRPSPLLVLDLVSNAHRRYLQHKYDDATARLYRALEMIAQVDFFAAVGVSTSSVRPDLLPESLRSEYVRKYGDPHRDTLKLPLAATFNALKEMDRPVGRQYCDAHRELAKLLSTRNSSILAHGANPVSRETYEKFENLIRTVFVPDELIPFPELVW